MKEKDGLYTNTELVDVLIADLNKLPKILFDNQFIALKDYKNYQDISIQLLASN